MIVCLSVLCEEKDVTLCNRGLFHDCLSVLCEEKNVTLCKQRAVS